MSATEWNQPRECTAAAERSRAALSAFMVGHYEQLARRLTWHLGCADLARDSLHDTWLRLADKDAFAAVDNPGAYVYRMACNLAMDRLRANKSWQYTGDGDTQLDLIADGVPGPDTIAEARSELEAVARALQRLPRLHQAILLALRVDELPRQEVATRYGLSLRRVDTALKKALACCAEATELCVAESL